MSKTSKKTETEITKHSRSVRGLEVSFNMDLFYEIALGYDLAPFVGIGVGLTYVKGTTSTMYHIN